MALTLIHTVTKEDIGKHESIPIKTTCKECGEIRLIYPFEPLGVVMACDIGKRIYRNAQGVCYVENAEQFQARLIKERG